MSHLKNDKIRVHLEMADGQIFMGESLMASINVEHGIKEVTRFDSLTRSYLPAQLEWNMELRGIGKPTWQHGGELAPGIVARFLPQEWECQYCGRANLLKYQQCQSCGWYRGLFVDVAQEAGVWRVKR